MPLYSLTKQKNTGKNFFKWTFLSEKLERETKALQFDVCCEVIDQILTVVVGINKEIDVYVLIWWVGRLYIMLDTAWVYLYFHKPQASENIAAHSCNIQPHGLLIQQIIIYYILPDFSSTYKTDIHCTYAVQRSLLHAYLISFKLLASF